MEKTEITYIYGLIDPKTNELRYIGKSINPKSRYRKHLSERFLRETYKDRWIRSVIDSGKKPHIEIIDIVDTTEWVYWEKFYISYYKMLGANLTNGTIGGDQPPSTKGRKHSKESRKKMSDSKKGKPIPWLNNGENRSDTHKKNLSESLKGKKSEKKGKTYEEIYGLEKSKKLRKKLSESHKGIYSGEKHPMYGKKHSDESIKKIKEKRSQQVFSEESFQKRSNANKIKVYKYNLDGILIKIYDSLGEAYKEVSVKRLNKHFKNGEPIEGFIWKKEKKENT